MERSELVELLSPEGLRLLDSLPTFDSKADIVATVSRLRKAGHPAGLVAAVLSQSKLRARAATKFGDFASRMLFTESGLEQATRLRVAALHAGRFASAGLHTVADLGCGIGGDAMAMAGLDLDVTAVDSDEVTAAVASYNLAPFPSARVLHCTAESADLTGMNAVWLDPARRTAGHTNTSRLVDPADYSPSIDFVLGLRERMPVGVKLGPGLDRDLIPDDAEAQWVCVDGQLVEMALWFGVLARDGIRRAALVLDAAGAHEMTADADSADAEVGPLGRYVYDPNPAVIRARLIGDLARSMHAGMLSPAIAYLTSDELVETPFAAAFRVTEQFRLNERTLTKELRGRRIGSLEIKKRGVDIDPADLRKRLNLAGPNSATLILTRQAGAHTAILTERVTSSG